MNETWNISPILIINNRNVKFFYNKDQESKNKNEL